MIEVENLREGYVEVVQHVLKNGERVAPRGMLTTEVRAATIRVADPSNVQPIGVGRNPNVAIGAAEAFQLVGGFNDAALMVRITKNFAMFMDHGYFFGSYGPRVRSQLPFVVERLKKDRDTRQAVLTIWDPKDDLFTPDSADYPCTLNLQFMIRNDKLEAFVDMRSNDVWWGLAYDAFQFTTLQWTIANALDIEAGPYHHHARSLHIYDKDLEAIDKLSVEPIEVQTLRGFGRPGTPIQHSMARTRALQAGEYLDDPTTTEQWFIDTLSPYIDMKESK